MAIYLDEDQVGADPQTIGYPHLLLCMGVTVVMNDGSLIGAHVSDTRTENIVMGQLHACITLHGGAMTQLYCAANVAVHCGQHNCMDITGKANALGFHGPGFLFDFGYINPRHGAFFEITSTGANSPATLRFKRNEKVAYTKTGMGPVATTAKLDWSGNQRTVVGPTMTVAAVGKAKTFLGHQTGQHLIKAVPAGQLQQVAL